MTPGLDRIERAAAKLVALIEEHDDLSGLLARYGSPERPDYRFVTQRASARPRAQRPAAPPDGMGSARGGELTPPHP